MHTITHILVNHGRFFFTLDQLTNNSKYQILWFNQDDIITYRSEPFWLKHSPFHPCSARDLYKHARVGIVEVS